MKKRITALILGIVMMLSDVCMVSAEDMTPEEALEMLRNGNTLPSVEDCSLYVDEWYFYTGEPVLPEVRVVTPEGDTLTDGTDYFLRCFGCEDTGTAKAVITGINGWKGSNTAEYEILPLDLSKKAEISVKDAVYTGKAVTPSVKITALGRTLEEGKDYTLDCTSYKVGKGSVNIDFIGNFCGSAEAEFNIVMPVPNAPVLHAMLDEKNHEITLYWDNVSGAQGYVLYRDDKVIGEYSKAGSIVYTDYNEGDKCVFSLKSMTADNEGNSYYSEGYVSAVQTRTVDRLFKLNEASDYFRMDKGYAGQLNEGLYSGHYIPGDDKYAAIDLCGGVYLIERSKLTERKEAVVLETGSIGQMGGEIYGESACGPTAAAILVNWQLTEDWSKDDLIRFCEEKKLNDQGSLRGGGGMTAPKLIELIDRFSEGLYTATNIYTGSDTAMELKNCIDSGKRALVVVQYTHEPVTHYSSGTHFIVICGYEYIDGQLYFYYADPYYGEGNRSLRRVDKDTLSTSMDMVKREPRCMIIAEK